MQIEGLDGQIPLKKARRDVGCHLVEQIRALVGPDYAVKIVRERSWASITFSGTRHNVAIQSLKGEGRGNTALSHSSVAQIGSHEFDLPGHFVADVLIDDRGTHDSGNGDAIMAEILTIIDPVAART